jgi:hypothetical protein
MEPNPRRIQTCYSNLHDAISGDYITYIHSLVVSKFKLKSKKGKKHIINRSCLNITLIWLSLNLKGYPYSM